MEVDEKALEQAIQAVQSRQHANRVALLGVTLTLMLNVGALIWGAATLSATVGFLGRQAEATAQQLGRTVDQLNAIETRVRLLEREHGS